MIDLKQKYEQLVEEISKYDHAYYVEDNPLISDWEYNRLYKTLVNMETNQPHLISPTSPTQRVGGKILPYFEEHKHTNKLYSLHNITSINEVKDFTKELDSNDLYGELKIDGLTVVLRYEQGELSVAATRGDGFTGEVVTEQIKTIKSIPLRIPYTGVIEIHGEVYMPLSVLAEYNKANPDKVLKNARNAAAGSIRNLDTKITAQRKLDAFFYAIPHCPNKQFTTQGEILEFLKELGFKTNPLSRHLKSIPEIEKYIKEVEQIRPRLNYEIDGIVLKLNNIQKRDSIGYTTKYPKWARAFKFESQMAVTILKDIVWNTRRTGMVSPRAFLEPVNIGGVTISHATLNNARFIRDKKLVIGEPVLIRRSQDLIPEIVEGIGKNTKKEIDIPTECPSCSSKLINKGDILFCINTSNCSSQQLSFLEFFVSKGVMDIQGLSTKTLELLYSKGLISTPTDLYYLKETDLSGIPGFRKKSIDNLLNAIAKSKENSVERVFISLGINLASRKVASLLFEKYSSIEEISQLQVENLLAIDGIGETIANNIYEYFNNPQNKLYLKELQECGLKFEKSQSISENEQTNTNNKLVGKTFLITGTLSKKRKEVELWIENNGGKIVSSVSKNLTYLIVGDKPGSKLDRAKKLNTPIINEQELYSLIN